MIRLNYNKYYWLHFSHIFLNYSNRKEYESEVCHINNHSVKKIFQKSNNFNISLRIWLFLKENKSLSDEAFKHKVNGHKKNIYLWPLTTTNCLTHKFSTLIIFLFKSKENLETLLIRKILAPIFIDSASFQFLYLTYFRTKDN
jgi:hypothetical protein